MIPGNIPLGLQQIELSRSQTASSPKSFFFFLMECSYPAVQRDTKWLPCIMQV